MTTTAYQITYNYGDYSHWEVLEQSFDLEGITYSYNEYVDETNRLRESGTDPVDVDSMELEQIQVTLDEDGEIDEVEDYQDLLFETIWNPLEVTK